MPDSVTLILLLPIEIVALVFVVRFISFVMKGDLGRVTIPVLLMLTLAFWKLAELLYLTLTRIGG